MSSVLNSPLNFFVSAPKGVDDLVVRELEGLGIQVKERSRAGVAFTGSLEDAYKVCLWSRVASRVLLQIAQVDATSSEVFYEQVRALPWEEHLSPRGTLAVDFSENGSRITNTQFAMQKVKDAVVDKLRLPDGTRPNVDTDKPNVRINVYAQGDVATVSIDISGDSLHRRAYRERGVAAPLKENLAAAMLLRAKWLDAAEKGLAFTDPMCGSGTLPIEAALIAHDIAPGIFRTRWGFTFWRGHDKEAWERVLAEAEARRTKGLEKTFDIRGSDRDPRAVETAQKNAYRAGLTQKISLDVAELNDIEPHADKGFLIVNPPYGERLGDAYDLVPLYKDLGQVLKRRFGGWTAHVLTSNEDLRYAIGLRTKDTHRLYNGPIECTLAHYILVAPRSEGDTLGGPPKVQLTSGAPMFKNRIEKNLKRLGAWAKREGIDCYRLYDADMPEYAVAVDVYENNVHVQEYAAPKSIDPKVAEARFNDVLAMLPEALDLPPDNIFSKVRRRQKGLDQYEKQDETGEMLPIHEGGHTFLVNFTDYLDTGIFLDHRITRKRVGELARGKDFLNLFCYTGTATVYAAKAGAKSTTSVDLSNTYLDWAEQNFEENGLSPDTNALVREDARVFLANTQDRFDVIFLDPPTFSNSKRMEGTLDIQRDHVDLILAALSCLREGGVLVFSTNFRRFKLDVAELGEAQVEDITAQTIPEDFKKNARIHQCYLIRP